jgi:hypothetical protein
MECDRRWRHDAIYGLSHEQIVILTKYEIRWLSLLPYSETSLLYGFSLDAFFARGHDVDSSGGNLPQLR